MDHSLAHNAFMRNLIINSWRRNHAPISLPFPTVEELLCQLKPLADLTNEALARLVLRLRARYPISLPLRAGSDVTAVVAWLTEAGAEVGVSTPPPALTPSLAQPLPVLAGTCASAASSPPRGGEIEQHKASPRVRGVAEPYGKLTEGDLV